MISLYSDFWIFFWQTDVEDVIEVGRVERLFHEEDELQSKVQNRRLKNKKFKKLDLDYMQLFLEKPSKFKSPTWAQPKPRFLPWSATGTTKPPTLNSMNSVKLSINFKTNSKKKGTLYLNFRQSRNRDLGHIW